jgi:DNA-directed RNA polymerase subunit M/transcription elongation factor TFIIS
VGLSASVEKVGARLRCPSCHANIVVPEAPKVSNPPGAVEKHEVYDVRPDDAGPDDRAYVTVLCPLCHTRMYATEDEMGQKMTCPDCGTDTTVARPVEFSAQKEEQAPVEFEGSTEYAVHEGDYRPPADYREANRLQIPVVCPLCHTRMHAEESQVGSTIVCPDCGTETLVPAAPDRQPEPEPRDVGEYDVGKPAEVFYPKFAQMLDKPLDEPDTPPGEERRRPTPPGAKPKPRKSRPAGSSRNPKPSAGRTDGSGANPSAEDIIRRPRKPPTFGRMFTFLADSEAGILWLMLSMMAAILVFASFESIEALLSEAQGPLATFPMIIVCAVCAIAAVLWFGAASMIGMTILEETAAGTDKIEEWPNITVVVSAEGVAIGFGFGVSGSVGYLLGQIPRVVGWPEWLGIPIGVFFLFPVVLLSLLERGSLVNLFSLTIGQSLLTKSRVWAAFYIQSALLWSAFFIIDFPCALLLGAWSAVVIGPWFTAIWMIYFRLLGRLAWHISGERVPKETIEPPDLSKLIERGEAEEIC